MQNMELKLGRNEGGVVKMEVVGKITRDGWPVGSDPIADIWGDEIYTRRVLMNLSRSLYIDSTGVEWLLMCHRRFQESGGMLVLHSAAPMTMRLLKMMRMDLVLNIKEDEKSGYQFAQSAAIENEQNGQIQGSNTAENHAS